MRKLFTSLVTSNMSTLERPTRFPTWVIAVAPQFFFSLWLKQESNGFSGVLYQTTWLLCQFTQNESHGISRTCNVQCDPASYFSSGLSSWPHLLRPFPYSLYSAYIGSQEFLTQASEWALLMAVCSLAILSLSGLLHHLPTGPLKPVCFFVFLQLWSLSWNSLNDFRQVIYLSWVSVYLPIKWGSC